MFQFKMGLVSGRKLNIILVHYRDQFPVVFKSDGKTHKKLTKQTVI